MKNVLFIFLLSFSISAKASETGEFHVQLPKWIGKVFSQEVASGSRSGGQTKHKEDSTGTGNSPASEALAVSEQDKSRAEELARVAEKLMQLSAFMYTKPILDQALALDPENFRAQFWSKKQGVIEVFRGYHARMRGLLHQLPPEELGQYQSMIQELRLENPAIYKFLSDGTNEFQNELELQADIDVFTEKLNNFREFLRANKSQEFKIFFHKTVSTQNSRQTQPFHCKSTLLLPADPETSQLPSVMVEGCRIESVHPLSLDYADFEALQHSVSGIQILSIFGNSYQSLGGIQAFANSKDFSLRNKIDEFFGQSELGKLRSGSAIEFIHSLGVEAVTGYRYFLSYQARLCRYRPDNLFTRGICTHEVGDTTGTRHLRMLFVVEASLAGRATSMSVYKDSSWYSGRVKIAPTTLLDGERLPVLETDMKLGQLVLNPIANLRSVRPTDYDSCGQIADLADRSVGGMLPANDVHLVLREMNQQGCN